MWNTCRSCKWIPGYHRCVWWSAQVVGPYRDLTTAVKSASLPPNRSESGPTLDTTIGLFCKQLNANDVNRKQHYSSSMRGSRVLGGHHSWLFIHFEGSKTLRISAYSVCESVLKRWTVVISNTCTPNACTLFMWTTDDMMSWSLLVVHCEPKMSLLSLLITESCVARDFSLQSNNFYIYLRIEWNIWVEINSIGYSIRDLKSPTNCRYFLR